MNDYFSMMFENYTTAQVLYIDDHAVTQSISSSIQQVIFIFLQTQLFETGKFSDFTIQCEGMDFKVHRVVLGPKSPVFMAAMDKEGPMLIRDVDSGTLQVCLISDCLILK